MRLKRFLAFVVAFAMVMSIMPAMSLTAFAETTVATVNGTGYSTFDEAITEANKLTGEVNVEIYGKVEYSASTANLKGSYDKINFVGKTEDAEICITRNSSDGYICGNADGTPDVNFSDLILSKPAGSYLGDAGYMNVYFTVYRAGDVTYTNCVFPDGACAQGASADGDYDVTYTNCEFANKTSGEYSLWVYANVDVTVDNCKFTGVRGVKMYTEGHNKTNSVTIKDTEFTSSVTEKPAIVLTYGESVTLSNNTYPAKGVFELDHEGNPNGTTVTADITDIACKNDNYDDCGVLVDGKIYTTITEAAKVATAGSTVTLMYEPEDETVELAEGVTLNKNGYTAANVTVKVSGPEGTISKAYTVQDEDRSRIYGEITGMKASESVVIKLYSDDVLLSTTTLANEEYLALTSLSYNIVVGGRTSSSWDTVWETGHPVSNVVPNKVVLFIDGEEMNTAEVTMDSKPDNIGTVTDWTTLEGVTIAPTGTNSPAYTKEVDGYVRVWGEGGGNASESFVLKLYSDETLIATTQLNNVGGIIDGDVYVTWNFFYPESNDEYWTTTWEEGHPNSAAQPTKVELWIDGTMVCETAAKMSGADDLNPVVWENLGGVKKVVTGLPTATVTAIENDELTFALNFKADEVTEEQLAYYGNWNADFVLTINKDVTFNANGGADGYLSGQYDAWSENWVNVPFENATIKAGEPLKIMEYAAGMLGQSGLKVTYADVYESVKDFDCGVFFTPEFLAANPDLEVTLELRMYNPENEEISYTIGETYTFYPLPTATVTDISAEELATEEAPDLTFAKKFTVVEPTAEQAAYYGDWYADFELTVNKDVTFNADGSADGYLAGSYNAWNEGAWVSVPFENVTLNADEPLKIMAYAAEMLGQSGLKVKYSDVLAVNEFDCGVFFTPEFLAANPDLEVTLELRMYNPENEAISYTIGETYTFEAPTVVATVTTTEGKVTNYATLEAAVEAAEAGDTITVYAPTVIEKDTTFDFKNIEMVGDVYPIIRVQNGATVTVKNGNITNGDYIFVLGASDSSSAGNLTIESGNYVGETTVASVTKGTLTITGGTFKAADELYSNVYTLNCIDANSKDGSASIVVKGGTFYKFNPDDNAADGAGTDYVPEGYVAKANGDNYTVREANYVAQIGDVQYETVEDALAAVEDGETITILDVEGNEVGTEINFTKSGTFTITGTAPNYKMPIITVKNENGTTVLNIENATLAMAELDARQNATINVVDSTINGANGNDIVKSYYNGVINISGTSVVNTMQVTTMGRINISDTAKITATWQTNVYGNGIITVNEGATFETAGLNVTGQAYSDRDNTEEDRVGKPATILVNGGTFKTLDETHAYYYEATDYVFGTETTYGLLQVTNGGTAVLNPEDDVITVNEGSALEINDAEATIKSLEDLNVTTTLEGYEVVYTDGVYSLEAKTYVAQIGDVQYTTLQAAVNTVEEEADEPTVITLLASVTEDITIDAWTTVELVTTSEYTYTGKVTLAGKGAWLVADEAIEDVVSTVDGTPVVNGVNDDNTKHGYVALPTGLTMVDGAQVRIGGGVDGNNKVIPTDSGIRFITSVNNVDTIVSYADINEESDKYKVGVDVTADGSSAVVDVPAVNWQNDDVTYTTAITNLAVSNYVRPYTATAYVYVDGIKYSESASVTRSIYQVAAGLLKEDSEKSATLIDVLNAYANQTGIRLVINGENKLVANTDKATSGSYKLGTDELHFVVSDANYDAATETYSVVLTAQGDAEIYTDNNYWYDYIRINNNNSYVRENVEVEKVEGNDKAVKLTFYPNGMNKETGNESATDAE